MATTTESEPKAAPKPAPAPLPAPAPVKVVIVDIGERQSSAEVRDLLKGSGKLMDHVERITADLVAAGTISGTAQPVVFVVRELSSPDDDDDDA